MSHLFFDELSLSYTRFIAQAFLDLKKESYEQKTDHQKHHQAGRLDLLRKVIMLTIHSKCNTEYHIITNKRRRKIAFFPIYFLTIES